MRRTLSLALVAALGLLMGCGPGGGGTAQTPKPQPAKQNTEPVGSNKQKTQTAPDAGAPSAASADDPAAIAALEKLNAVFQRDEHGNVIAVELPDDTTDASLKHLQHLPALRNVGLAWTKITDAGLEQLAALQQLETLDLSSTPITDEGLEHLASLKNLKTVIVEGTDVTPVGKKRIRESLPQLVVQIEAVGIEPKNGRRPDEPAADDKSPTGQFRAIVAERDAAMEKLSDEYQALQTKEERAKLLAAFAWDAPFAQRVLELVQANPQDKVAFEALAWILKTERGDGLAALKAQAVAALKDGGHLENPRIVELFDTLQTQPSKPGALLLRAALEKNLPPAAQAQATYALAKTLQGLADAAAQLEGMSPDEREKLEQRAGKDAVEALAGDSAALRKEAAEMFQQVIDKFAGVPKVGRALAKAAEGSKFEIEHFAIGAQALEIVGKDIDGNTLKLSDYRGRVVMLDFWGHW